MDLAQLDVTRSAGVHVGRLALCLELAQAQALLVRTGRVS